MEMPILIIRCPGAPGGRHGALGASAALYARNAVAVVPRRRGHRRALWCWWWWLPGGGAAVDVDGVVGSAEDDEAEMTASMASAIAASSASALGKWTRPCRPNGDASGGRGWSGCGGTGTGTTCRSDPEDGVAAGVTAIVRGSDVEPSAAGLPTETDGREDDGDDGPVGGSWSSSSSSDCWKKSSENTWCKLDSKLMGDPLAAVDMPTSISPLSHPMNAAICACIASSSQTR